jgi:hypothetical protein
MMGFLGTITGLIKAFMAWEHLGANITVSALAAGIYEAMITTAAGLIVAIPCFVMYHLLIGKIKSHAQEISYYGNELIDILEGGREGGGAGCPGSIGQGPRLRFSTLGEMGEPRPEVLPRVLSGTYEDRFSNLAFIGGARCTAWRAK